jgi:septal ring factor EnvC (AmiA/AmiB activator)
LITKNSSYLKDNELKSTKQEIEKITKEIKLEEFQCKSIRRDLAEWNLSISTTAIKTSNLKFRKHKLLMDCKVISYYFSMYKILTI